ncbi:hypothetical protein QBC33DRAFT_560824 [Phialemonium atrogriseum]|uniref:Uncharacterized protein n=1 Tax=Phialemonium atrogriseum TaxID=1093897 RepID=A0AAJ0BVY4_9PEZI|nr:uncharacterized protein QBC33DRAFT_560824 [Phialemonium atrogriseum]KAK1765458.1 hypothetical protein QBC33DRAFT_560824 [Phialemonium atrogriseum]
MKQFIPTLLFALPALATPAPAPDTAADDPQSTILLCADTNHGGSCINWSQKSHCWDFQDPALNPFNDQVSSAYPATPNIAWVLHADYNCGGAQVTITAPGADDLNSLGFNDKVSALSWHVA